MEGLAKGGGEVRRLHIIYFLSRMGHIDHPHLLYVHHLNRNNVYLRDIKRWLADLRGKDMPEAFAWSYKRRYKTGYVWQDLLEDDPITPISDNEYVLKGSQIIISSLNSDSLAHSYAEENSCLFKDEQQQQQPQPIKVELKQEYPPKINIHTQTQTKLSSEIKQESPHNLTDEFDAIKELQKERVNSQESGASKPNSNSTNCHEKMTEELENYSSSFYSNLLSKKKTDKDKDGKQKMSFSNSNTPSSSHSSSSSSSSSSSLSSSHDQSPNGFAKSRKSNSGNMFRNLLSCGAVDTNDSVLVMSANRVKSTSSDQHIIKSYRHPISRGDKSASGSARVFGTCWNQQELPHQPQRKSYDGENRSNKQQKPVSTAYRPVGGPHCSQCRKVFKPEKLHSHMKSCGGMKSLTKTAAASVEKKPEMGLNTSTTYKESASGYFMTS